MVVTECLFIQVAEQVEGFHAHIRFIQAALQERPKIFDSIRVNLAVNIPFRMVNNRMLVFISGPICLASAATRKWRQLRSTVCLITHIFFFTCRQPSRWPRPFNFSNLTLPNG
jgi:hypothetical protein